MSTDKRAAPGSPEREEGALVAVKRQRTGEGAVVVADSNVRARRARAAGPITRAACRPAGAARPLPGPRQRLGAAAPDRRRPSPQGVKRTSGLQAPIMQLVGHGAEVLAARFDPSGDVVASASADKCIFLWRTYGECENYMMLTGHKNAVLELGWFQDGARLVSCSADTSVRGWDAEVGQQIKRVNEHTAIVNSVSTLRRGAPLFVSGSDDNTIKVRRCRAGGTAGWRRRRLAALLAGWRRRLAALLAGWRRRLAALLAGWRRRLAALLAGWRRRLAALLAAAAACCRCCLLAALLAGGAACWCRWLAGAAGWLAQLAGAADAGARRRAAQRRARAAGAAWPSRGPSAPPPLLTRRPPLPPADRQVWDMRVKRSSATMTDSWQVTSTTFNEAGDAVYSAGLDNTIKVRSCATWAPAQGGNRAAAAAAAAAAGGSD
jgi:hypothetical protein